MDFDLIVPAAGSGHRMKAGKNKLLLPLGGKTVFYYTLKHISQLPITGRVIVVCKPTERSLLQAEVKALDGSKLNLVWLDGGVKRSDSVNKGLKYILQYPKASVVMVHDGARPFLTLRLIQDLLEALVDAPVAVPAIEVTETARRLLAGGETKIVERSGLYLTQTPQAFRADLIQQVFFSGQANNALYTDEASYFEAAGMTVSLVAGEVMNIKLTCKGDLALAASYLKIFHTGM